MARSRACSDNGKDDTTCFTSPLALRCAIFNEKSAIDTMCPACTPCGVIPRHGGSVFSLIFDPVYAKCRTAQRHDQGAANQVGNHSASLSGRRSGKFHLPSDWDYEILPIFPHEHDFVWVSFLGIQQSPSLNLFE